MDISVEDHLTVELQIMENDFRVYSFLCRYVPIGVVKTGDRTDNLKDAFIKDGFSSYMKTIYAGGVHFAYTYRRLYKMWRLAVGVNSG